MAFIATIHARLTQIAAVVAVTAAMTGLIVDASAQVRTGEPGVMATVATAISTAPLFEPRARPVTLRWEGRDVDGDGAADFVNPTGLNMRAVDHYGYGHFGASRDGGVREHKGVDYRATAGQPVKAPISGYVTKIGLAYSGDSHLKFVEIRNPALRYEARVFYIDPDVREGQAVHLGDVIGTMHTLQDKYPEGMTDHVHLEVIDKAGRRIDAAKVLTAELVPARDIGVAD